MFKQLEDAKKKADEVAKLQLSQVQSSYNEMKSNLSVVEFENLSLKSEKRKLVSRVSTTRDQVRQKVQQRVFMIILLFMVGVSIEDS